MALPWTAPGFGQGIYPGQAPFYVPQPISPYMAALIARQQEQRQQQISGAIQDALSTVGKYMEKRQQDQMANQLLAQANAPKATPVTPDTLYGEPSTALSADELARNQALGFGATPGQAPDLGGVQAYKMQLAAAENQAKLAALNALTGQREAQQAHLNRLGFGGGGGAGVTGAPTVDPATGLLWNGRMWVKPPAGARVRPTAQDKTTAEMAGYGLSFDDLGNIDAAQTDIIPPKGNAGQKMLIVTKNGKQATVPWATWQKWSNFYNQGGARGTQPLNQGDVNQAAAALGNQAPLPAPDVPAQDYGQSIPTEQLGKPLDTDTARSILAEAGGDKEKARTLAKQRGYVF